MIFRFLSLKEWLPSAQLCVVLKELLPSWSFGFAPKGSCCLLVIWIIWVRSGKKRGLFDRMDVFLEELLPS